MSENCPNIFYLTYDSDINGVPATISDSFLTSSINYWEQTNDNDFIVGVFPEQVQDVMMSRYLLPSTHNKENQLGVYMGHPLVIVTNEN
jgi:hypothetical protein